MTRTGPCTGSRRSKRPASGDGYGGPRKRQQQGGALAPPQLDIHQLRENWRSLYKMDATPQLSHDLLVRVIPEWLSGNAELTQPSYEPAGTVEQIELIFLSAVDVERLQPAEIVRLGFDRNDRILS